MAGINTDVDFSESRAAELNSVGWVFTGAAIAAVVLKLFARVEIVKRVGWDDFFIFFSLALSIIATAVVSYSITLGFGRHTAAVIVEHGMERTATTAFWQIVAFPFNIGAFSFPNISISILISNLLDPNVLRTRFLYGMSIIQVALAMVNVVIVFVQCTPTEKLWNASISGTCWDPAVFNDFSYFVSAYTTMTDIILAIVPIRVFWNLQMPSSKKISICIMMGLTLLSAIVTVVKATYLHLFTDKTDPLWNLVPLVVWGLIEQNVVIVAACVPTIRPLIRRALKSKNTTTGTGTSRSRSGLAIQLLSNPRPSGAKHLPSVSQLPLDDRQKSSNDGGDHESLHGIWRTREVRVESDEEADWDSVGRNYKASVPANLQSTR